MIALIALVPVGCFEGSKNEAATVRPCRASNLTGKLEFNGATGSLIGGIVVTNVGKSSCSLLGPPHVRFVGGAASRERLLITNMKPRSGLGKLRAGEAAGVDLIWRNWCGPHSRPASGGGTPPDALVLTLPSTGGELRLLVAYRTASNATVHFAPGCDVPRLPSELQMSGFVAVSKPS